MRQLAATVALLVAPAAVLAQYVPTIPEGLPTTPNPEVGAPRRGALGWWTTAGVTGQATATNNANYGASPDREPDLILEIKPWVAFNRQGDRLRVNGYVGADLIDYVNGTQTSRVLPQASVLANLEAIENLFYFDASLTANQSYENVFLPRPEFSSTNNQYTYAQARIAPYLQSQIGQNISWLIRSDNSYTWTTQTDNPLGNAYYGRHLAQIVRNPTPFGLTLQVSRDETRIQDSQQEPQVLDTALAILNYQVTSQLVFGLRGGYENTTYTAEDTAGPIYGANLTWKPSPLTSVDGYWESRFYGPSYQVTASNRHYRLATTFTAFRTVSTYPQLLLQLPSTTNVSALLDAILTARFPDPLKRQEQVADLIERQGLPTSLPAGAFVYNQSANILTGSNLNFALVGARNTLALNVFYLKTAMLPDARIPPTFLSFNNSEQTGAGITLSHRVTPTLTANAVVSGYQSKGFGPTEGQETREGITSAQLTWQLSMRTSYFVGARYQFQKVRSVLPDFSDSSAASIFTGISHTL